MNNLFSKYVSIIVIRERSVYDLFSRYNAILVIINKLKVISTPLRSVVFH